MPEAHLSKEQSQAFIGFVRSNKDSINREVLETNTEGYTIGETKTPMFIVFDTHVDRPGEAKLYYPTELEGQLLESGVIFERSKKTPEVFSAGHREPVSN
ncbi:MAG: hypothetical protein HYT08_02400 [Candidatus Levybacteria bacterium]|nr:hypothetical protein [Candidatus Levybacteria bacterium]